ncbi:MAG: glycosyltransferase [Turicibacter sp.]|nr:glycosyltransferase [Turicibacter sp.]
MDKVSIIMPAYNAEKTIRTSVESVLQQTYTNWELIIIDDCSADATASLIPSDPRIMILKNAKNAGVSYSRNEGIRQSTGGFLAFLDADDMWTPDKLAKQLAFMLENKADISYTATAYINERKPTNYILRAKYRLTYADLLRSNLMSCSSVVVKRAEMPLFLETDCIHEDYVAWLTIVKKVGFAYGLDEPLLLYRISANSKSSARFSSAKMIFNAYCTQFGKIIAFFCTLRYSAHSISKRCKIKGGRD